MKSKSVLFALVAGLSLFSGMLFATDRQDGERHGLLADVDLAIEDSAAREGCWGKDPNIEGVLCTCRQEGVANKFSNLTACISYYCEKGFCGDP